MVQAGHRTQIHPAPMFLIALISLLMVSATILVHASGTAWWLQRLQRLNQRSPGERSRTRNTTLLIVLIKTAWVLVVLHAFEVFLWALAYRYLAERGFTSLEEAMYFSFTTFTTLGYGDITLDGPWRLLTGVESLNGILLVGWSTALSFAVIQRLWQNTDKPPAS